MPELPEVETIKLFLAQNIIGLKVESVEVLNPKSFLGDQVLITGKEIESVERRGKVLRIRFTDEELLIHLKMSGQMIFRRSEIRNPKYGNFAGGHPTKDITGNMPNRSTRVIFNLNNGSKLFFNDQRKFGWVKLVNRDQVIGGSFFEKFGPEPLEKELSWEVLKKNLLRRKKTPIKVALLDQEIVAGVGNIYACEACFIAGIDTRKKIIELTDGEFKKIHNAVIEALKNGIKYGGSSKTHFISPEGRKGLFLDHAFVYGRERLPCKNCRTLIRKIKLGGRGTFYCPNCQPVD